MEKNVSKTYRKAAEQWILDRSTLRRIQKRTKIPFVTKWRQVQTYAKYIPSPLENYIKNKRRASHVLLLDATFIKIKGEGRAIMIAYDTGIGVIDYWIDVTENKTAYHYLFQRLEKLKYDILCVVSDGHWSLLPAIEERSLPHQRCIFHLLKNLRKSLTKEGSWKKPEDQVLYARMKGLLKTNTLEDLVERMNAFRRFQSLFPSGREEVFKWFWQMLPSAVLHLSCPEKVPRTTALIENLSGQIKQRIKTMRGMKSEQSLDNLLKILFYLRNYK